MLKHIKYLKNTQCPFVRALRIRSSLQNSKSAQTKKIESNTKAASDVDIVGKVPCVIADQTYRYKEGSIYEGFQCERIVSIPDFGLTSCSLRHLRSGTEFWYLDRNDVHNVFSIIFRTTPFNSAGVSHILEHLTLCGSKKYPVRDPFFKMINRSVATFMNALTGPDYTIYPFSTMNEVDFRNLQKIYLDAVFRPNLLYLDFLQEGWRIEYMDVHNPESDLAIKGVVYNEMIGAFSDNAQLFKQKLQNYILPSHTYGNIAGGNPMEIPKLTHKDLVEFHRKYYHPSNARIFCYGSFDLEKTLAFVDKEYLSHYERIDTAYSSVPAQERWTRPRNVHIPSRMDSMGPSFDRQNQIAIGLLMCDINDVQENFELSVLSQVMINGPNSVFYKSLIEPNFSGGYCKGSGYLPDCKDTYFVVGLRDLSVEDFNKFNERFDDTLHRASQDGFDPKHIESVLCNLELSLKHESEYFGRQLLYKSIVLWNHGGDVVSSLRVSQMISNLRQKLKDNPNYFQEKLKKYFINNSHKLTLTMSPDEMHDINYKLSEAELLVQKLNEISDEEFDQIYENGIKLEAAQKTTESLRILPCLSQNDVQDPIKPPQMVEFTIQAVHTQLCKVSSNGITYLKFMFNITGLSEEDALLMPLFCNVISEMGTSRNDFRQFDKLLRTKMSPITCVTKVVENIMNGKSYSVQLIMSTYALDANVSDMFKLCAELMMNFKLDDKERLKMLIVNYISMLSFEFASSGHLSAMLGSSGLVTNAAKLKSLLGGVGHIDHMRQYVQQNSIEDIQVRLRNIGTKVFNKRNMQVAINCSDSYQSTVLGQYEKFLKNLTASEEMESKSISELHLLEPSSQHYFFNSPLSYCAKTFSAVPYVHEDHPVLRVLAKFLAAKYLLPVVREQNGAYGAGAKIGFDGLFSFYSYRDPNGIKTIEVFDKTYEWLQGERSKLDNQAIFEAKLGVLQLVDWPTGPADIGIDNFLLGASYDIYSSYRSRVLSVTLDDMNRIIEKYFKNQPEHYGKYILGPESGAVEEEEHNRVKI